ncbi:MAG: hypothetical protein FWD03_00290 [Defluviitaleaceae bacterium]|nr:hypothetical protein [Defluviitaleaceae bacterium]
MKAIQGIYKNGAIMLEEDVFVDNVRVMVIFPSGVPNVASRDDMSTEEAVGILEAFKGCIKRDFNYEEERDEYLYEKYGPFN